MVEVLTDTLRALNTQEQEGLPTLLQYNDRMGSAWGTTLFTASISLGHRTPTTMAKMSVWLRAAAKDLCLSCTATSTCQGGRGVGVMPALLNGMLLEHFKGARLTAALRAGNGLLGSLLVASVVPEGWR